MSEPSSIKNFPFSRKEASESLIDTDTDEDDERQLADVNTDESRFITKQFVSNFLWYI